MCTSALCPAKLNSQDFTWSSSLSPDGILVRISFDHHRLFFRRYHIPQQVVITCLQDIWHVITHIGSYIIWVDDGAGCSRLQEFGYSLCLRQQLPLEVQRPCDP